MFESAGDGGHAPFRMAVAAHVLRPPQHLLVLPGRSDPQPDRMPPGQHPPGGRAGPAVVVQPEHRRRLAGVRPPARPPVAYLPSVGPPGFAVPRPQVVLLVRSGHRCAERCSGQRREDQGDAPGDRRDEQQQHHGGELHGVGQIRVRAGGDQTTGRVPRVRCATTPGGELHDGGHRRRGHQHGQLRHDQHPGAVQLDQPGPRPVAHLEGQRGYEPEQQGGEDSHLQ